MERKYTLFIESCLYLGDIADFDLNPPQPNGALDWSFIPWITARLSPAWTDNAPK
jgi:hypothetical protein